MTGDPDLATIRRAFANRLAALGQLESADLIEAFAQVPREDFVGPGPWQLMRPPFAGGYEDTPDANPARLYDTVAVALDASRFLNNGEPSGLSAWLDALRLRRGCRFLHIGCGVGYYTAIAAHAVRPGTAVAIEADTELAARAARHLAAYDTVTVRHGTDAALDDEPFDAIFVNAGATDIAPTWLQLLTDGGRLLVPLTVTRPLGAVTGRIGLGHVLLVERRGERHLARFISPVGVFHCVGARTEEGEAALQRAFQRGNGDAVRSLRLDRHDAQPGCWLHRESFCLSSG